MNTFILIALLLGVLILATVGTTAFILGTFDQHEIVRNEVPMLKNRDLRGQIFTRCDKILVRIPALKRIPPLLVQANLRRIRASEFLLLLTFGFFVVFFALSNVLALPWALLLSCLGVAITFYVLTLLRHRQYERFIAQLPELARILANATGAGLSINTAMHIAADELPDPAGREMKHLSHELDIGVPIDLAFDRLSERVPGKDLAVLVSTLVISHRAGGSLISALRDLSTTLETRKETKREVKTIVAESSYTGYMVAGLGIGMVIMVSLFKPDVLYDLTSTVVGQIAIIVSVAGYSLGIFMINRMTRVKL